MATRSPDPAAGPTFSDSWVLLAVAYAGGKRGADLASVVAVADYINHAVLTYEEASSSFERLTAQRWVRVLRGRFVASASVLGALPNGRSRVHTDLERVRALLHSKAPRSKIESSFSLSRAAFDEAVKSYLDSVRVRVNAEPAKRAKSGRSLRRVR